MRPIIVLDASAFDLLSSAAPDDRQSLLDDTTQVADVLCAAVTLAEVCRTRARTRQVEAILRPRIGEQGIRVVATDASLAKAVGQLLGAAQRGSCHLADAHVVALCARADRAVVITSDPDDINHLAASLPGVRIVTRRP